MNQSKTVCVASGLISLSLSQCLYSTQAHRVYRQVPRSVPLCASLLQVLGSVHRMVIYVREQYINGLSMRVHTFVARRLTCSQGATHSGPPWSSQAALMAGMSDSCASGAVSTVHIPSGWMDMLQPALEWYRQPALEQSAVGLTDVLHVIECRLCL